MNRQPLENEPGHGAPAPTSASEEGLAIHFLKTSVYNLEVRLGTLIAAMVEQLRKPPANFAAACTAHFSLKRYEIAAQAVQWCEEAVLYSIFCAEALKSPLEAFNVEKKRLCKEFLASGACRNGTACRYAHIKVDGGATDYRRFAQFLKPTYHVFGACDPRPPSSSSVVY